jgi:hypothetical protein
VKKKIRKNQGLKNLKRAIALPSVRALLGAQKKAVSSF